MGVLLLPAFGWLERKIIRSEEDEQLACIRISTVASALYVYTVQRNEAMVSSMYVLLFISLSSPSSGFRMQRSRQKTGMSLRRIHEYVLILLILRCVITSEVTYMCRQVLTRLLLQSQHLHKRPYGYPPLLNPSILFSALSTQSTS